MCRGPRTNCFRFAIKTGVDQHRRRPVPVSTQTSFYHNLFRPKPVPAPVPAPSRAPPPCERYMGLLPEQENQNRNKRTQDYPNARPSNGTGIGVNLEPVNRNRLEPKPYETNPHRTGTGSEPVIVGGVRGFDRRSWCVKSVCNENV